MNDNQSEKKVVDLDEVKFNANKYVEAKREASEYNKTLKEMFKDTESEVTQYLDNGGQLTYKYVEAKPGFDYKGYSAFLQMQVSRGVKLDEAQLEEYKAQFIKPAASKWKLTIKAK
ncbi:hypothetical protein [Mycoplasmopsis synoviae]|uniref:Uncharacterized protein n=1 Tax=Mycoplasmopsis synoviae (strain 53) TaxID=262723 RepID=Q4A5R6_MYCS5|nr:hypothetical protein [Mycoplasmopsis synoviae]AAZ43905.1 hypothetical protein MS53_0496 [Mycoplasmopsis synoviae 53]